MIRRFAKLFETNLGQILVLRRSGDDGPEITIFFNPGVEGAGLCRIDINFPDSEEGETAADFGFDLIDEDKVAKAVSEQIASIRKIFSEAEA